MDSMKIGRRRELEIAERLVKEGILSIYWQPPRAKWADQDIFALFDLVGVMPSGSIALVQVSRRRGAGTRKTAIERWAVGYHPNAHLFVAYYDSKEGKVDKVFVHALGWNDMRWCEATRWTVCPSEGRTAIGAEGSS